MLSSPQVQMGFITLAFVGIIGFTVYNALKKGDVEQGRAGMKRVAYKILITYLQTFGQIKSLFPSLLDFLLGPPSSASSMLIPIATVDCAFPGVLVYQTF